MIKSTYIIISKRKITFYFCFYFCLLRSTSLRILTKQTQNYPHLFNLNPLILKLFSSFLFDLTHFSAPSPPTSDNSATTHQARVAVQHRHTSNLAPPHIKLAPPCIIAAHLISHQRISNLASAIALLLSLWFVYFWVECELICVCSCYLERLCYMDLSFHFLLSFSLLIYLCLCKTFCNFWSHCSFVLLLDLFLCSILLFVVFAMLHLFKIRKLGNVWYHWSFWCFFFSFVARVRSCE